MTLFNLFNLIIYMITNAALRIHEIYIFIVNFVRFLFYWFFTIINWHTHATIANNSISHRVCWWIQGTTLVVNGVLTMWPLTHAVFSRVHLLMIIVLPINPTRLWMVCRCCFSRWGVALSNCVRVWYRFVSCSFDKPKDIFASSPEWS